MSKLNIIYLLIFLLLSSCSTSSIESGPDCENICCQIPCYEGPFDPPWVSAYHAGLEYYSPEGNTWTHDNRVYETENFLIFSDASSDEAKIRLGESCEKALDRIKPMFQISSQDLGIVDQQTKFRIFSIQRGDRGGDRAATNGFAIQGYDSSTFLNSDIYQERYPRVVAHELAHVIQYNMGGYFSQVHDWFVEGFAEYVSTGVFQPVTCWPEVVAWREDPLHENPISIEALRQLPESVWAEHYPLFHLAFRYLVDPQGLGNSLLDVKDFCADIRAGINFAEALESRLGMNRDYYEEKFWALMKAFLPAVCDENSVFRIQGSRFKVEPFWHELPPVDIIKKN